VRKILWSEGARADIRRVDRDTAMRIFAALHRFASIGEGDVQKLKGESGDLRFARAITASGSPRDQTIVFTSIPYATAVKRTAELSIKRG
jgi:hypothetical protein